MHRFPTPILLCATLLCIGSGCTREIQRASPDAFRHEEHPLPAPAPSLEGGIWVLHENTPLFMGGISAQTGAVSDALFILDAAEGIWRRNEAPLPLAVGDGRAFAGREGVLLLPSVSATAEAPPMVWLRPSGANYQTIVLPPLPSGERPMTAAIARGNVFVLAAAPLAHSRIFRLPASSIGHVAEWSDLGPAPGITNTASLAAVQLDGERPRLYLVSSDEGGGAPGSSLALYSFELQKPQWHHHGPLPGQPAPGILTPGGIAHLYALSPSDASDRNARWHVFNTITQSWVGPISVPAHGTPVGSSIQGTRLTSLHVDESGAATLLESTYEVRTRSLHPVDYTVLGAFMLVLFGIGWLHSHAGGSADHYFRGGRNVNWVAAGIAIVATRLSSTSFVAIPAKAFATNLQYAMIPLTNIFGAFIMSRWFVKFFVRLNVTSGYEYLEKRFTPLVRTIGSLNYLLFEVARIGILIVVPAVVLAAVARFDLTATILVVGSVATLYTVLGGIKGVVWADTFQILVKVVGLIIALISVFFLIRGDLTEMAGVAWDEGKLRVIDWSWDLTRDTIWVFILFWLTDGLKSYVANQIIIQQFISTRNEKTAKQTIWTSAILGVVVTWLLLLIGVGLYLYYRQHPERFDLMIDKPDGVFPWFIVFELPAGVVGILLAALIAAAMSSLDQALLSSSTIMVTDFYRRFRTDTSDASALRMGRYLTLAMGLFATTVALFMSGMAVKSLIDQTLRLIGLFGGGLGGLFLLGMLTTRASGTSALCGLAVSVGVQYFVSQHTSMHLLTYMFSGMTSCFVVGYLFGYLFPERKSLDGLTIHTTPER